MIRNLLLVGLGGGLGSMARYIIHRLLPANPFPWGTFTINIAGSLIIGLCWGLVTRNLLVHDWKLFLMTGICGGFTTFSAFSLESIHLFQESRTFIFLLYAAGSVVLCLAGTMAGIKITDVLK